MGDQQFCLRWNNYQENITRILDRLLQSEVLVDVTLYIGGRSIRAHKTILSACSPYFENMFRENTHPHPIVILKDFCFEDIRGLLDFMYKGEVNVTQARLGSFIKVAETLEVRGLASDNKDDTQEQTCSENGVSESKDESHPTAKRRRKRLAPINEDSSFSRDDPNRKVPPPQPKHRSEQSEPPPLVSVPIAQVQPSLSTVPPLVPQKSEPVIPRTSTPQTLHLEQPQDSSLNLEGHSPAGIALLEPDASMKVELPENLPTDQPEIKEENDSNIDMDDEPEILEEYSNLDLEDSADGAQSLMDQSGDDLSQLSLPPGSLPEGVEGSSSGAHTSRPRTALCYTRTADGRYQCKICGVCGHEAFRSNHLVLHFPQDAHCPICFKVFKHARNVKYHVIMSHGGT